MNFDNKLQHATAFSSAGLTDIIFLLLIFFLLSSSFIVQPGMKIVLPQSVTNEVPQENDRAIISIDKNEQFYLNGNLVNEEQLQQGLYDQIQQSSSKIVVIEADKDVRHELVVRAMDYARRANAQKLHIATEPISK